ncbi:hypothetical protein HID58_025603 [Brassica napus]|uniref:Uncharacterized protein n=1 Tax=Brassica napus TaxID=3708 RepID=A0ABQ8CLP2_BRANA|nr:hypothetical protein HID58_025603 [Brassica napus]
MLSAVHVSGHVTNSSFEKPTRVPGCRCCFNPTIELLLWWYPSSASIRLQLFPSSSENAHHYEIRLHTFIIIKIIINSIYPIHSTVLQLIRPPTFQSPINSRMRINYADQPGSYFYLLCQCFQDGFIHHVPISAVHVSRYVTNSSFEKPTRVPGCRCCFNPTIELLLWWYPSSASIRLQLFPSSSENAHHYEIRLHTFIIIKIIINSIYPIHSTVLQLIRPPTFQSVNLYVYRLVCIRKIHQPINSRMRINYADQPGSYFDLLCQCFQDEFIHHVPISLRSVWSNGIPRLKERVFLMIRIQ